MEAVEQLFRLMGIENVAKIFFDDVNKSERKRNNYYPEIYNFFNLIFTKYAQRNPQSKATKTGKKMKLSIITVNLNDAAGLRKTIESIVSQTFSDFEYIIIDGGSADGSMDVVKQYENRVVYWVSEPDKGVYNAMNKGILQAKGEYCLFLNSGDTLYSEIGLETVFKSGDTEDIIVGNRIKQYPKKEIVEKGIAYNRVREGKSLTLFDFFISNIPHQATFIKRELFDRYGLYDENYTIVSDWLFFLKTIVFDCVKVKYIDATIARFDMEGISNANMTLHMQERRKILEELLPPTILADYDHFEKIDADFRKLFKYKVPYYLGRLINKTVTLCELILIKCRFRKFQS
jgi:glycosyltransferase involved in cell wall biosynthesis